MKLIHSQTTVIALAVDDVIVSTPHSVFSGTREECVTEATRLSLSDPKDVFVDKRTPTKKARDLFLAQPSEVKDQFSPHFQIIASLTSDADKAFLIEALAVPEELESIRAELVSILRG